MTESNNFSPYDRLRGHNYSNVIAEFVKAHWSKIEEKSGDYMALGKYFGKKYGIELSDSQMEDVGSDIEMSFRSLLAAPKVEKRLEKKAKKLEEKKGVAGKISGFHHDIEKYYDDKRD